MKSIKLSGIIRTLTNSNSNTHKITGISRIIRNLTDRNTNIHKNTRMSRLIRSTTICNTNTHRDTILTVIALIPIIPGGMLMSIKYLKNMSFSFNYTWYRIYNLANHKHYFHSIYGMELL